MLTNQYYIYVLASKNNSTLYVGETNDLRRRLWEHKNGVVDGFTKRYCVDKLVYYECCNDVNTAISREKTIKKWSRAKKERVITEFNPDWHDLNEDISQ